MKLEDVCWGSIYMPEKEFPRPMVRVNEFCSRPYDPDHADTPLEIHSLEDWVRVINREEAIAELRVIEDMHLEPHPR